MGKLGFFKGLKTANAKVLGDIEGPMTNVKSGKMPLSVIEGKLTMWAVGVEDAILNKADVQELAYLSTQNVKDLASGGGKVYTVNTYRIVTAKGSGVLRAVAGTETELMSFLK